MAQDYYTLLGLAPGRYSQQEITRSYDEARERLLGQLSDPRHHADSRQRLEVLHIAYTTLANPDAQAEYLRTRFEGDGATRLRRLIDASLEDGLLRYSRRQHILTEGRRAGFSDFQTQLLIAQVQFGDEDIAPISGTPQERPARARGRAWARLAAVGVLALALFLAMMRWLAT